MLHFVRMAVDCCGISLRNIRVLWTPWCVWLPQTSPHDYLRAQNAKKRGGDFHQVAYDSLAIAQIPSQYGSETIERQVQLNEIAAMIEGVGELHTSSARDRAIFWLHFHWGMSANSIAQISRFHLTSKGVQSSLRRTVGMLKKNSQESTVEALRLRSDS